MEIKRKISQTEIDEINSAHTMVVALALATIEKGREASTIAWGIGKAICEMKESVPDGEWIEFVDKNLPSIGRWKCDSYVRFYKRNTQLSELKEVFIPKQLPLWAGVQDAIVETSEKTQSDTCHTYLGWIQKVRLAIPVDRLNELSAESRIRIKTGLEPLVKLYNAL